MTAKRWTIIGTIASVLSVLIAVVAWPKPSQAAEQEMSVHQQAADNGANLNIQGTAGNVTLNIGQMGGEQEAKNKVVLDHGKPGDIAVAKEPGIPDVNDEKQSWLVCLAPRGTEVKELEEKKVGPYTYRKVQILKGLHKGKTGWVMAGATKHS